MRYNEKIMRDEFFGFGKKKADVKLSWDKASKIVKKALEDLAKRHRNVDWSNHGQAEISRIKNYVTLNSRTGAWIQYSDGGRVVAVSPDVDEKKFECPIENGKVIGLEKVFDYFDKLDQKQGMLNVKKNKPFDKLDRKESIYHRMKNISLNNVIDESTDKNEKISSNKINKMKDNFGSFAWFDLKSSGYEDYTCYATGHCAIVSNDKELREKVAEVEPEQKYMTYLERELIKLIDATAKGGDINWQNTGVMVGAMKDPSEEYSSDKKESAKDGDVFSDKNRIIFFYNDSNVEIIKTNFVEFLRMFSGNVSGNTPVYYSYKMDAIGLCYKGECGLLMAAMS